MTDISLQFHALPEEVLPPFRRFVEDAHGHVVAIRFNPFEASLAEPAELEQLFADSSIRRLAVTLRPPDLSANGMNQFLDHNPGALLLEIGRSTPDGLRESWLTARTDDADTLSKWRGLLKKLRSLTKAGAMAVNPETGARAKMRSHRFTAGAKALERNGTPILPAAGGARIELGD
jgi:hypothetical protein